MMTPPQGLSTRHLYAHIKGLVYYKVFNLANHVSNADQLTVDVERYSNSVVDLYSNMSKPLVDITIYAVKLSSSIGPEGPLLMISYLMALGLFLPWVRQPTSRFTMTEQQMRGTFRFMKSRLSTHSEENSLTKRGQNCVNRFVSDYSSAFIHTSYDLGATVLFQQMNSSVNMVAKWCMNGTLKFFQTTVIKLSFG
ncbi:hypothetical protein PF008_g10237 [Phytophthora fragariae]|uniref:ABC transmembrane type-1 domain-containing protein n=1 Tax=Phytophthora fragariae TaxID=53985 RepID=A0A6G0RUE4_9STRA|nr:hypothetical protein PF008_g10237 [Phytophthora fragariae]